MKIIAHIFLWLLPFVSMAATVNRSVVADGATSALIWPTNFFTVNGRLMFPGGTQGYVLKADTNSSSGFAWSPDLGGESSTGTVMSVGFTFPQGTVAGAPITGSGTITVNLTNVPAATNITLYGGGWTGKLTNQNAGVTNKAAVYDSAGALTNAATTAAEIAYLAGVTGGVQTNIDARATKTNAQIYAGSWTGRLTNQNAGVASKAAVYDAAGVLTNSATTATEVGYLAGVTGGIQTNIDARVANTNASIWGAIDLYSAGTEDGVTFDVQDAGETFYLRDMYGDIIMAGLASAGVLAVPTYAMQVESIYANGGRLTNTFLHFPFYITNETTMSQGMKFDSDDGHMKVMVGDTGAEIMRIDPSRTNVSFMHEVELYNLSTNHVLITRERSSGGKAILTNSVVTATELALLSGLTGQPVTTNFFKDASGEVVGSGTDYTMTTGSHARIDFSGQDPEINTLPSAGTYIITCSIYTRSDYSTEAFYYYKLYDATGVADIPNSEIKSFIPSGKGNHATLTAKITVTVPSRIQLYGYANAATYIKTEAAYCKMTYHRIY
jgi:hypothetical protein